MGKRRGRREVDDETFKGSQDQRKAKWHTHERHPRPTVPSERIIRRGAYSERAGHPISIKPRHHRA